MDVFTASQYSWWLPDIGRGSLSSELEGDFRHLEVANQGNRGIPVVFYWLADCWMSWDAAKCAASWGYKQIYWYPDGIDGRDAAKLPTADAEPVP